MCEPYSIASAAIVLASTLASSRAAHQQAQARDQAAAAEIRRQSEYEKQAADKFAQSQGKFSRPEQDKQIQVVQQDLGQKYGNAVQNADFGAGDIPLGEGAPQIVKSAAAGKLADTLSKGRERARALANLNAFGESNFLNQIALGRTDQDLARRGNFSAGSQNILPLELQAANQAGSGAAMAGDILGALGSVVGYAGATGYSPFAATGESPIPPTFRPNVPVPAPKPAVPSSYFALR